MSKESVLKEIELIHKNYLEEGGKSIKPTFKYLVVRTMTDDFITAKTLQQAKDKIFEYGDKLEDIFDLYEIKLFSDGTYRACIRYCYFPCKNLREDNDIKNCMHVAWRTRGELLEVVE
jgi:hypothetical protein